MTAPERIWMTGEDHVASWPGSFRAFRCSSLDHGNDDGPNPDYPEYIRKDASDAAIAAARAEGVREGMLKAAGMCQVRADQHVNSLELSWRGGRLHERLNERRSEATSLRNIMMDAAEAQP